jgi:diguanylate cyclase (GGDEF)-like protein
MSSVQLFSLARRLKQHLYLLFADVDGLKWINDTLGHAEGDSALRNMARLLKSTFRDSDIIARIGGDEFVVVGSCKTAEGAMTARERLLLALHEHNLHSGACYDLSISTGLVSAGPAQTLSVDDLLAEADSAMYEEKQEHRAAAAGRGRGRSLHGGDRGDTDTTA